MAKFEWTGDDRMYAALENSVQKFPGICQAMLKDAAQYILFELKLANTTFQRFWKANKPKHNNLGWFVAVVLKGKTSSGTPAALAANVYEYGRGGKHPQPARPFIRKTLKDCEGQVQDIMQGTYDRYMKEVTRV